MTPARAALRVLWGPASGTRLVLVPDASVVVGRSRDCDLALAHDEELSSEHFSITWDGVRGSVQDLQSRRGTLVGGEPISGPCALRRGAWIRAGETDLVLDVEAPGPTSVRRSVPRPLAEAAAAGRLWAIVDASRGDRVLQLLRTTMDPGRSLYEGPQGSALEPVAPFLVHLEVTSRLLAALVDEGWDRGWAVYLLSDEDERALRRQLRRLLVVEAEGVGSRTYFRFYDPAVLASFWPIATQHQRRDLSRGIQAWLVPGEGDDLMELTFVPDGEYDE